MLDVNLLRRDLDGVINKLETRKKPQTFLDRECYAALESERKTIQTRTEELQGKRFEMVSLFSELAKTIADGAQVTTIKQTGADLTIQGRAQSNARVSSYMKNIMASPVINDPDLTVIEARGGDRSLPYEFILNAKVKKPAAETEEDVTAPAVGASQ